MADNSKDVELRIRARDYSQKTLSDVTTSLKELVAAQQQQQAAAERGEVTASELEASYRKLESAAKALLGQNALAETFQTQGRALEEAKARTEAARAAQEEYARTLAALDAPTKRQVAELAKLERAVAGAEKAQQKAADRVDATAAKLGTYGIATAEVASAQSKIAAGVREANAALERQDDALAKVDVHLRAARQAAEAKAVADRESAQAAAAAVAAAERQAAADAKAAKASAAEVKAQKEMQHALNKAADEAIAAAKGYDTLASSINSLGGDSLADALRGIADPAAAAIKGLEGIEAGVEKFETQVASIKGPIKDYRDSLNGLEAIQKSLANVGGMIDAFRRQEDAVARAKTEYDAAKAAVRDLAQQMRESNAPVSELTRQMNQAQARLRTAATEMRNQQQAAQNLREALHQAGVSTRNLADAEDRMITAATRAKTATDGLTAAYKKYGVEVKSADKASMDKWFNNGRTTLSWMQRIRGELLGLATAYVGVQAAIGLAKGALEAYRSTQTIESRLSILVGNDSKAISEEWDYLMGQADRLGFGFERLALDYAKFGISAKSAGMSLQETRFIFEKMAEASRGAKLTTEEFGGVMTAVEQMLSKGTISSEELRQQLGDRLPGAFAAAARGAGMSMEEFHKALELGNISSEYVINLAREAGDNYKTAFDIGSKSLAAAEGRLQTAGFEFRKAIAEGGFVTAYSQFIEQLTDLLRSNEGAQLAQLLSDGFTAVIDVLRWCAENTDLVKMAFAAFIGMNVAGVLSSWVPAITSLAGGVQKLFGFVSMLKKGVPALLTSMTGMGTAAGAGAAGVTGMTMALRLLMVALKMGLRLVPLLGWAITAWEVYDLIAGKKDDAAKAGEEIGKAAAEGFAKGTEDPGTGGTESERVRKAILKTLGKEDERTAKMDVDVRKKDAKADLAERLKIAAEPFEAMKRQAQAYITDKEKLNATLEAIEKSSLARQAVEREKFRLEQWNADRGAAERRRRLAEDIARELEAIEADLAKRKAMQDPNNTYAEREAARLRDVAHAYDALQKKISQMAQFDKKGAKAAKEKLDGYILARQEIERIAVKQEELNRLEAQLNRQVSLRSSLLAAVQAEYDAGNMSMLEYRDRVAEVNEMMGTGIADAGKRLREFAESMRDLMSPAAFQELMARVSATVTANHGATRNMAQDMSNAETDLNRILAERTRINDHIQQQFDLGLITDRQRADQITANNELYKEQTILAADSVIAYAEAMANPANQEAMDALIAKMQALKLETEYTTQAFTQLDATIVSSIVNNGAAAFDAMAQSMAQMIQGQKSASDMFKDMGRAAAQFFAQFMRDIAMAIIKQQILNALRAMGGPIGAAAGAAGGVQSHGGGVVGSNGNHTRRVDSSWFAGAPRYHNGGLPGIQPNEVPSILEKGEEVLARDDPRNVLNGAGGGDGAKSTRFVLVDDRSNVAEAMTTADGEEAVMLNIRRNIPSIKQMLG